jgi:hypothetical protein
MPEIDTLDPELVKRLRVALESAQNRRFIAVPVGTDDLEKIIEHLEREVTP